VSVHIKQRRVKRFLGQPRRARAAAVQHSLRRRRAIADRQLLIAPVCGYIIGLCTIIRAQHGL